MAMPGRSFSAGSQYRYGFNGQENSDEIAAGLTTAMYWEYDSRIGRRWNVDPDLDYDLSSYHAFGNNPILYIDHDGRHQYRIGEDGKMKKTKTKDQFDEFYLLRNSEGNGAKIWERVAKFDKNNKDLIAIEPSFRSGNWGWNYTGSKKENYISGDAMAAMIGTLSNSNLTVSFNHWSNADGTSPSPSKSHKNGTVGDVRPIRKDRSGAKVLVSDFQFDLEASTSFIKNAELFGWTSVLSERYNGWITPGTTNFTTPRHNNHYHLQRFKPLIDLTTYLSVDSPVSTEPKLYFKVVVPKMAADAIHIKPPQNNFLRK